MNESTWTPSPKDPGANRLQSVDIRSPREVKDELRLLVSVHSELADSSLADLVPVLTSGQDPVQVEFIQAPGIPSEPQCKAPWLSELGRGVRSRRQAQLLREPGATAGGGSTPHNLVSLCGHVPMQSCGSVKNPQARASIVA